MRTLARFAALGMSAAAVALVIAVAGLPYGRLNYTAFAELYHNGIDTTGHVHLVIDCEPATLKTQDHCSFYASPLAPPPEFTVAVTLANGTGTSFRLSSFQFVVINPDQTRIDALTVDNPGAFDDNPDFFPQAGTWDCGSPPPADDLTPGAPEDSFISCVNDQGDGPSIGGGLCTCSGGEENLLPLHHKLATITYSTAAIVNPGSVPLSIEHAIISDDTFSEVASCNPVIGVSADCVGAIIEFGANCAGDLDCDGHKNPLPQGHPAYNASADYDNCPTVLNLDQLNGDGNFIDQSPPYMVDDLSLARSDGAGDACDNDLDNDGLLDSGAMAEPSCNGSGTLDYLSADTDGDRVMDGAECALGTNPTDAASKPPFPAAADDPDNDRLSTAFELSIGSDPNDIDSDNDGLQDGWEYKGYNTNPRSAESDGDGARDGCEVASLNVDTVVNPGDQALLAAEILRAAPPAKLANMDLNKDGVINPGDQAFQASMALPGKCPLVMPWP